MKVTKPRGTRDFPPKEMHERNHAKEMIESLFIRYNYHEILSPTMEHSQLFRVKSGEEIGEHMYVFQDKGGREMCLRPEATASVCRMFVDSLRDLKKPVKVYYSCPMFRYERPQKGRYREFWQMGVELLGSGGWEADSEVIYLACKSMEALSLEFTLEIGHIGVLRNLMTDMDLDDRIQDKVIYYLDTEEEDKLVDVVGDETILELVKLKGSDGILEKAGSILEGYVRAQKTIGELSDVVGLLDAQGVKYTINLGMGRGLEYYTGVVFEMRVKGLGAENQVCGGGRYDELVELFGGPPTPAVGFAFGFDRVLDAMKEQGVVFPERKVDVLVAPVSREVWADAFKVASRLRENFVTDIDLLNRKLGKILDYGNGLGARFVVIVGSEELSRGEVTLKDMSSGDQSRVEIKELVRELSERLG
ncbi:MAG: histidine--tRNA ligase [Candidatus Altiarchaeales archaeon ex4484_2]|nr:MAG: histidine--tRNA ligase [Candidatus Altiarchaeales archaeon ex4484_2]